MIRIAALNSRSGFSGLGDVDDTEAIQAGATSEAQEAEATALYNTALVQLNRGSRNEAKLAFHEVLKLPFMRQTPSDAEHSVNTISLLKYSTYKNLAELTHTDGNLNEALEYYIQAVSVDSTDVTVWHRIGKLAETLCNYPLAQIAFETGLKCNSKHWPCLDSVLAVLYSLNNYEACLYYITKALQREPSYEKGLAFAAAIFRECPYLRSWAKDSFKNCDLPYEGANVGREKAEEYVKEALEMRRRRQDVSRTSNPPVVTTPQTLNTITWKCLGECLIELYDEINRSVNGSPQKIQSPSDSKLGFGCRVDLSAILRSPKKSNNSSLPIMSHSEGSILPLDLSEAPPEPMDTEMVVDIATGNPIDGNIGNGNTITGNPTDSSTGNTINGNPVAESLMAPLIVGAPSNDITMVPAEEATNTCTAEIVEPVGTVTAVEADPVQHDLTSEFEMDTLNTVAVEMEADKTNTAAVESEVGGQIISTSESGAQSASRKRRATVVDELLPYESKRRSSRVKNPVKNKEEVIIGGMSHHDVFTALMPARLRTQMTDLVNSCCDSSSHYLTSAATVTDHTVAPICSDTDAATSEAPSAVPPTTEDWSSFIEESEAVRVFIDAYEVNGGVIDLLSEFLIAVARRSHMRWSKGLPEVFTRAYAKVRKHLLFPDLLCCTKEGDERLRDMAMMVLVDVELRIDRWLRNPALGADLASPRRKSPGRSSLTLQKFPGKFFKTDLNFLMDASVRQYVFGAFAPEFTARVHWVRAKCSLVRNDVDCAVDSFQRISECLAELSASQVDAQVSDSSIKMEEVSLSIVNCTVDNIISAQTVRVKLDALHSCRSLDEIKKLVEDGNHTKVVELLLASVTSRGVGGNRGTCDMVIRRSMLERQAEMMTLVNSLLLLKNYELVVVWAEECLNDLVQAFFDERNSGHALKSDQESMIMQTMVSLKLCICDDDVACVLSSLSDAKLSRLARNLIRVIDTVLNEDREIKMNQVTPWVLLYKVFKFVETEDSARIASLKNREEGNSSEFVGGGDNGGQSCMISEFVAGGGKGEQILKMGDCITGGGDGNGSGGLRRREKEGKEDDEDPRMPSSLALLIAAHEQLGTHMRCMSWRGELLLFAANALISEFEQWTAGGGGSPRGEEGDEDEAENHPFKDEVETAIEQCFFCLYGHPKKTRSKHLEDHGAAPIALTWEQCPLLFNFFKPKVMPEYDSLKTSSVSADLEFLLRRIYDLIPSSDQLDEALKSVRLYIDGSIDVLLPEFVLSENDAGSSVIKELYYLLADYYFKNQEPLKAMDFYMRDLCVSVSRFDTWAGMALSCSSKLAEKLSSFELKPEVSVEKEATSTLRCFKKALEIDTSNVKLWIEYGSTAYLLHSHTSRQLKQLTGAPITEDILKEATTTHREMLLLARTCYRNANACTQLEAKDPGGGGGGGGDGAGEEWLQHYMLGKIAEKLQAEEPIIYLEHYKQAAQYLHANRAKYPKKISYYNPPHLSVETLEMYYRLHVSIIKYLMEHESDKKAIPYDTLETYVKQASEGPLANCQEYRNIAYRKSEQTEADDNNSCSNISTSRTTTSAVSTSDIFSKPLTRSSLSTTASKSTTLHHVIEMDTGSIHPVVSGTIEGTAPQDATPMVIAQESMESGIKVSQYGVTNDAASVELKPDGLVSPLIPETVVAEESLCRVTTHASPDTKQLITIDHDMNVSMSRDKILDSIVKPDDFIDDSNMEIGTALAAEVAGAILCDALGHGRNIKIEKKEGLIEDNDPMKTLEDEKGDEANRFKDRDEAARTKITISPDCPGMPTNLSSDGSLVSNDKATVEAGTLLMTNKGVKLEQNGSQEFSSFTVLVKDVKIEEQVVHESSGLSMTIEDVKAEEDATLESAKEVNFDATIEEDKNRADESVQKEIFEPEQNRTIWPDATLRESSDEKLETSSASVQRHMSIISIVSSISEDEQWFETNNTFHMSPALIPKQSEAVLECAVNDAENIVAKTLEATMAEEVVNADLKTGNIDHHYETADLDPLSNLSKSNCERLSILSNVEISSSLGKTLNSDNGVSKSSCGDILNDQKDSSTIDIFPDIRSTLRFPLNNDAGLDLYKLEDKDKVEEIIIDNDISVAKRFKERLDLGKGPADVLLGITQAVVHANEQEEKMEAFTEASRAIQHTDEETKAGNAVENLSNNEGSGNGANIELCSSDCAATEAEASGTATRESNEKFGQLGDNSIQLDDKSGRLADDSTQLEDKSGQLLEKSDKIIEISEQIIEKSGQLDEKSDQLDRNTDQLGGKSGQLVDKSGQIVENLSHLMDVVVQIDSEQIRYHTLMENCVKALGLCLSRFPQHFKSLYRLAFIYFYSVDFKNVSYSKDLLLGCTQSPHPAHMPCPGLFQERKPSNFFQGVWRIPTEDIDRVGTFSAHICRAILLLFKVLVVTKDSRMLCHIHAQLMRVPDTGKKYLRECDRAQLAKTAFQLCYEAAAASITVAGVSGLSNAPMVNQSERASADRVLVPTAGDKASTEAVVDVQFVVNIFSLRQQAHKSHMLEKEFDELLCRTYVQLTKSTNSNPVALVEEAKLFCLRQCSLPHGDRMMTASSAAQSSSLIGSPSSGVVSSVSTMGGIIDLSESRRTDSSSNSDQFRPIIEAPELASCIDIVQVTKVGKHHRYKSSMFHQQMPRDLNIEELVKLAKKNAEQTMLAAQSSLTHRSPQALAGHIPSTYRHPSFSVPHSSTSVFPRNYPTSLLPGHQQLVSRAAVSMPQPSSVSQMRGTVPQSRAQHFPAYQQGGFNKSRVSRPLQATIQQKRDGGDFQGPKTYASSTGCISHQSRQTSPIHSFAQTNQTSTSTSSYAGLHASAYPQNTRNASPTRPQQLQQQQQQQQQRQQQQPRFHSRVTSPQTVSSFSPSYAELSPPSQEYSYPNVYGNKSIGLRQQFRGSALLRQHLTQAVPVSSGRGGPRPQAASQRSSLEQNVASRSGTGTTNEPVEVIELSEGEEEDAGSAENSKDDDDDSDDDDSDYNNDDDDDADEDYATGRRVQRSAHGSRGTQSSKTCRPLNPAVQPNQLAPRATHPSMNWATANQPSQQHPIVAGTMRGQYMASGVQNRQAFGVGNMSSLGNSKASSLGSVPASRFGSVPASKHANFPAYRIGGVSASTRCNMPMMTTSETVQTAGISRFPVTTGADISTATLLASLPLEARALLVMPPGNNPQTKNQQNKNRASVQPNVSRALVRTDSQIRGGTKTISAGSSVYRPRTDMPVAKSNVAANVTLTPGQASDASSSDDCVVIS